MLIDRPVADVARYAGDAVTVVGPGYEELGSASAVIAGARPWDATLFDRAPRLRVLSRTGIGVDSVDLAEATRRGVLVTNTPDGPTVSTAEHAVALILATAKTLPDQQERLRLGTGNYSVASTATELATLTLGLVGFGRIARRVAAAGRALGMTVVANDPLVDPEAVGGDAAGVELVAFDELLGRSDVLSLHCPLLPSNRGLFDRDTFGRCKPRMIFVNAARGGLVDHDALVEALDAGHIRSAGLDVTEPEPLPPGHTLLHRSNVIVTPHVAAATEAGRERMLSMAIDQALRALRGERPSHLVNPEVWPQRALSRWV
jgi:phosphoglycerate dehydrogenase-like enzyme